MLQTAWDLATTDDLPLTVQVWALASKPAGPVQFADALAARISSLQTRFSGGGIALDETGTNATRTLTLQTTGPDSPQGYPIQWDACAVVDTDQGGALLALIVLPGTARLEAPGQMWPSKHVLNVTRAP